MVFVGAEQGGDTDPSQTGNREGSAYAFVRAPGSVEWVRETRILAPDASPGDEFGAAVAVAPLLGGHPGDALALVGAPRRPFDALREGRALAFRRDGAAGTWAFETELFFPNASTGDVGRFGDAVALLPVTGGADGEVLALIGAPRAEECEGIANAGVTYAFLRTPDGQGGATWTLEERLCPGTPRADSRSGSAIAADAHAVVPFAGARTVRVLTGTRPGPVPSEGHPGAADLFEREVDAATGTVTWTRRATFASGTKGSQGADFFGAAVALAGDFAFVGASASDVAAPSAGAVFVYGPDPVTTNETVTQPSGVDVSIRMQPNPVVSKTEVRFRVAASGQVEVSVYDVLGRRVATLQDGALPAGEHVLRWQPSGLAPGVYVVRVATSEGSRSRTVTLVR